jgi:TPP-dependent pyruvate/acetoin dehydrogenase alpha subunit
VDVSTQTWNDLKYMRSTSLYCVKAIYNDRQQLLRCVCTCKTYLCSTFRCSHVLVMLDVRQKYSICQMCTNMTASNKNKIMESSDKSNVSSVLIVAGDSVARLFHN